MINLLKMHEIALTYCRTLEMYKIRGLCKISIVHIVLGGPRWPTRLWSQLYEPQAQRFGEIAFLTLFHDYFILSSVDIFNIIIAIYSFRNNARVPSSLDPNSLDPDQIDRTCF